MSSFAHLHCSLFWTHTAHTQIEQHCIIISSLSSLVTTRDWPGHQRGLPRTVLTHDAVASAAAQLEGCVAEQRLHLNRGRAGLRNARSKADVSGATKAHYHRTSGWGSSRWWKRLGTKIDENTGETTEKEKQSIFLEGLVYVKWLHFCVDFHTFQLHISCSPSLGMWQTKVASPLSAFSFPLAAVLAAAFGAFFGKTLSSTSRIEVNF